IIGIDPHAVPIGVDTQCATTVRLSTVFRNAKYRRHPINSIGVARIDTNLRVVEWACVTESAPAGTGRLVSVSQGPGRTTVARAIDAAVGLLAPAGIGFFAAPERPRQRVRLDPRINDLRIRWRDGD